MKAATEKRGFENGLLGEAIDDERNCTESILLLVVLLTVPIRDKLFGGRYGGLIGIRKGAGCWPLRLSDAMESRIPPSLLPDCDIGGVVGIVAALLNLRG